MARRNRRDVIDESTVGEYHVWSRTVRRAFLTGVDPQTGRDYSYRKEQLERRLEALAGLFAVECLEFDVLDNHFEAILRNRPDLVAGWTDEEVARRWLQLERSELELKDEPTPERIAEFVADVERVACARGALSSISEFMAHLKEPIARRSNFVERCTGCFWQGRFGAERLRDKAELLACSLCANLQPLRAGLATTAEEAAHTSGRARLLDEADGDPNKSRSGWLAPVSIDGDGYDGAGRRRRASNRGFLAMTGGEYRELLGAVARRELKLPCAGELSVYLPVVRRLGIGPAQWEYTLQVMSRRFERELRVMAMMYEEAGRSY